VRRARVVVTHAGVGSIIVSLSNGKKPVVVPRLKQYAEAVDDHQLFFGRRFAEAGLVTFVESPDGLRDALAAEHDGAGLAPKAGALAGDLRSFLERSIAA
jgi:UDP-N-acetylglucosamine transferase subunit ALG13